MTPQHMALDQLVHSHFNGGGEHLRRSNKSISRERAVKKGTTIPKQTKIKKANNGQVEDEGSADTANGSDEDEDDSNDPNALAEDDEEPEVFAPSGGLRSAHPTVSIDGGREDSFTVNNADNRQAGPTSGTLNVPTTTKKRTYSNMSVLSADGIDEDQHPTSFPRMKLNRKVSNSSGRWQYSESEARALRAIAAEVEAEQAVASDDDDDEVYKKVDEIEDTDDDELDDSKLEDGEANLASITEAPAANAAGELHVTQASDDDDEDEEAGSEDEFWMNQRLSSYFGSGMYGPQEELFETGPAMFEQAPGSDQAVPSFMRRKSEASERRVRFDDNVVVKFSSPSSSSGSSEFDFNTFPDLLDDHSRSPYEKSPFKSLGDLNRELRDQIRAGDDENFFLAGDSDATESEFDFGEKEAAQHMFSKHGTINAPSPETVESAEDSGSLSGYDCERLQSMQL